MKNIWFIILCVSTFLSCENTKSSLQNPLALVPDHTDLIFKINASESLDNGLKNNALIKELAQYTEIQDFTSLLAPFHQLNKSQSLITLSKDQNDSLEIGFIIPFSKDHSAIDSISELKKDTTYLNDLPIDKWRYKDQTFFSTLIDSTLFASNKLDCVKKALKPKTINSELEALYRTTSNEKMVSLFILHKKGKQAPVFFRDTLLNALKFSDYTMIDSDIAQNSILINGITKASDSTKSLINIFNKTIAQENKVASILPQDIAHFKSITFNNYNLFRENLIKHQLQDTLDTNADLFQNIVEAAEIYHENQEAIVLRSIDITSTLDHLNTQVISDEFRDIPLYPIEDATFINNFSPILKIQSAKHFIVLEDFIVFSESIAFLESIISNYQNGNVLSESLTFKDIKLKLSDESSLFIYSNADMLNTLLNLNFTDDKKLNLATYKSSAIQFVYDTNFAHVNGILKTSKTKGNNQSVVEELNIALDSDVLSQPQLVKNHTNNEMDIVVQDINNNLYLISNQGKVFWKKQLDGKILGGINQMDMYKNGRLQLVFNTTRQLYVIDRNGKDVSPFPLKFKDEITQPVSLFDYDKNKNYRLMVTQGKSVLMYDKTGKIVNGFTYKSADHFISSQPKHFRIGRKDYIVFSHGNRLQILDRTGKQRIKVNENISFSDNEIYLYNDKFTTTNTNGELLEIDQKGIVNHKNLKVNSEHKIATTSKTLVIMNDNKLTIKSNTLPLDFGEYTAPKIFYINDKIYITVTDLQSKKGYLFDSQAKAIANFPIYANSALELNSIDKDNSLEVITKGDNDAIIIYEIH